MGIFGRKKQERLIMTLGQFGARLDSALSKEAEDSESARPIIEKIMETRREIERILSELDRKDFSQFYKPIITAKPLFINGMMTAVKSIKIKEPANHTNLVGFHQSVAGALKSMQSVQIGPGRFVGVAFREDIIRLGKAVKKTVQYSDELGRILSKKSARNALLDESVSLHRKLCEKIAELGNARTEREEGENEIEKYGMEKARLERELGEVESSDAMKEVTSLKAEFDRLKNEKYEIERMIATQVSPLKRTFRKFWKVVEREKYKLDRRCANALETFIDEPAKIFSSDCDALIEILKGSKESILGGELELDIKEKERALSAIDELIYDILDEARKRYTEIKEREKSLDDTIGSSTVLVQKDGIIREIGQIEKQIKSVKMRLEQIDERDMVNSITTLKSLMETKLSEFEGREIEIKMPAIS